MFEKEATLFEKSVPGRRAVGEFEDENQELKQSPIPNTQLRKGEVEGFPELSEVDIMRHYTRISMWNYFVDANFYPLGSCTMKYNPRSNEKIAALPKLLHSHPAQPDSQVQGSLELLWSAQEMLAILSGMRAVSLQPAAGAQGELCALLMFAAYHRDAGQGKERNIILIPDSAHGTNPASAALAGFEVQPFASGTSGLIDLDNVRKAIEKAGSGRVAGAMVTNPNTLGFFEPQIFQVSELLHQIGALLYIDGANFNAILGRTDFGSMGADAVHFNLHKTFAAPHGGGGPGSGPVAVSEKLIPFLPGPVVQREKDGSFVRYQPEKSIGKVKSFFGNFSVIMKALAYIRTMGRQHIPEISERAVLNANYIKKRLSPYLHNPYPGANLHEVVFSDSELKKEFGITALDIAKALLDYGFHAPTIYFPLIVSGALMIEPTETESRETLDAFCDAVIAIIEKGKKEKGSLAAHPATSVIGRLDETVAARQPVLRWSNR